MLYYGICAKKGNSSNKGQGWRVKKSGRGTNKLGMEMRTKAEKLGEAAHRIVGLTYSFQRSHNSKRKKLKKEVLSVEDNSSSPGCP